MSLYDTYLNQAKEFHKNEKKWRGTTVIEYIPLIDEVRKKHNIETMLDYGCGKAQNHQHIGKHINTTQLFLSIVINLKQSLI